jgi:choline-sulfatase
MRPSLARGLLAASLAATVACGGAGGGSARRPRFAPASLNVVLVTLDTVRADRLPAYGYDRHRHADARRHRARRRALHRRGGDGAVHAAGAQLDPHRPLSAAPRRARERRLRARRRRADGGRAIARRRLRHGRLRLRLRARRALGDRARLRHLRRRLRPQAIAGANLASAQRDGTETVASATAWLDARPPGKPFFLWLHLYDAHDPYTPPEPFASRYPDRPYEAEIAYVDSLVGRLRAELEGRGLLASTALAVTADHGEGLGDHREQFHGYFVYDSTVHVPLLLRLPGGELAGRVVDTAVSHVDLVPTLLELAGQPPATGLDGTSLLAIAAAPFDPARATYSESLYPLLHYGWAPLRSLRRAGHKWIEAPRPELYDLVADAGETANVLAGERRVAAELRRELAALRERLETAAPAAAPAADLDEATLAQLAALGYLAGQGGVSPDDETAVARADPKDRIALHHAVMTAQNAIGAGEPAVARRELERILGEDAGILDAHQMLGSLAAEEGGWEEAAASFRRALAIDAEHRASLFGLANAYRRLGRDDEALVGFERLLALQPHDSKAALAAADLLTARGERERAIALLERIAAAAEAPPIVANQLGELLVAEGRADAARAAFERALAGNAELVQPHFNLAVLAEESGDAAAAIAHYEAVIARAPKHFQALFNLGRMLGARGESSRQRELWQAAIAANPEFVRGYYYLAKLLMDSGGDLARAEELTRAGIARDDDHHAGPLGYYLLADLLNRAGRATEARAAVEQARRIEAATGALR